MFRIPLTKPFIPAGTERAVAEVLASGFLTEGPRVRALEAGIAERTGRRFAIAATSATTGLEMAVRSLGLGPGDEVLVPDYTHPATGLAVMAAGATVVLVDVDPRTMLMDVDAALKALGPRTRAALPVSAFGAPLDYCDLDRLRAAGLAVVEDAACSLGARCGAIPAGGWGEAAVFSLHPRKTLTTGEGGIVVTDDEVLARWMRGYKLFGSEAEPGQHLPRFVREGTNGKLSDINAAIGLVQLAAYDDMLEKRRAAAAHYDAHLAGLAGISRPDVIPGGIHAMQSYVILIPERDRVLTRLREGGIEVQIGTYALHRQPVFQPGPKVRWPRHPTASAQIYDQALALPLHCTISAAEQDEVVAALAAAL
jgi:perosamine synthetase